jgi:predicted membrane chloride channel (bestrophin family)
MRAIASLPHVVNLKSVLVAGLAVLSTWVSLRFGITADFPLTLIATAIVFPLVFSISTAYNRREKALDDYGRLKALGRSLYLASRDWVPRDEGRDSELQAALYELFSASRDMFTRPLSEMESYEARIFAAFDRLSLFVQAMREAELSPTECSRLNQYVSHMMVAFENIKHIYEYRTPRTLRAFSEFFILLLSILYGPYFAYQAVEFMPDLFFVMPALFALILVGLSNIQDHLENPFDQIGQDDVAIDPDHFVRSLGNNPMAAAADAR